MFPSLDVAINRVLYQVGPPIKKINLYWETRVESFLFFLSLLPLLIINIRESLKTALFTKYCVMKKTIAFKTQAIFFPSLVFHQKFRVFRGSLKLIDKIKPFLFYWFGKKMAYVLKAIVFFITQYFVKRAVFRDSLQ